MQSATLRGLGHRAVEVGRRRRRVRERPRRLRTQAVQREGDVAPPELRCKPACGLDHTAELPQQDLDVGWCEVGPKRSLCLPFRHELIHQRSDALAGGGELRLLAQAQCEDVEEGAVLELQLHRALEQELESGEGVVLA